jgi:hypothetical protein
MDLPVGTKVWFPAVWEVGTLDSILLGSNGRIIAYVIKKDDGSKVAVDMQVAEVFEDE